MKKIILVTLDGAPDTMRPSPLEMARTPNLDYMAENGICGLMDNEITGKDFSEAANFNILGYLEHPGRGYTEAIGVGLNPGKYDICFRCNFATVTHDMIVLDRRAGREEVGLDEMSESLNGMRIKDCDITFKHSIGHRGVLVISGDELSEHVSDTDPKKEGKKVKKSFATLPEHHPEFPVAKRTARILNEFTDESYRILSKHEANKKRNVMANIILSRTPGRYMEMKPFEKKYGLKGACIAAVTGSIGVGKILGLNAVQVGNGLTNTDLGAKIEQLFNLIKTHDFVWLHIKGADVAAHDKKFTEKRLFLERVDREVFSQLINIDNALIVVTSDHITSSQTGEHVLGYVPILIYGAEEKDSVKKFDEESVKFGDLGIIQASNLMEKLISLR